MAPRLVHPGIKPTPEVIAFSKAAHLDLLRLRASTPLLRMPTAQAIRDRVSFPGSGLQGRPDLIAMHIDGRGWPGSPHAAILVVFNASSEPGALVLEPELATTWDLHPVHRAPGAADGRIREQAHWWADQRRMTVPPRSATVFVTP